VGCQFETKQQLFQIFESIRGWFAHATNNVDCLNNGMVISPIQNKKKTPFWKEQCQMMHQKHIIKKINSILIPIIHKSNKNFYVGQNDIPFHEYQQHYINPPCYMWFDIKNFNLMKKFILISISILIVSIHICAK
jgi:hypothetical protein